MMAVACKTIDILQVSQILPTIWQTLWFTQNVSQSGLNSWSVHMCQFLSKFRFGYFMTIFKIFLKIILFYVYQSACHIQANICDTSRIPTYKTRFQNGTISLGFVYLEILDIIFGNFSNNFFLGREEFEVHILTCSVMIKTICSNPGCLANPNLRRYHWDFWLYK